MLLLFDFDGTLVDSKKSIVNATMRTLHDYSLEYPEEQEIIESIGLPIKSLLENYVHVDELESVISRFRQLLIEESRKTDKVYPDVLAGLNILKNLGCKMKIVTNKRASLAEEISKILGIDSFFDEIVGIEFGEPKPSGEMLKYAIRNKSSEEFTVMIGDRREDLVAAESAALPSVLLHRGERQVSTSGLNRYLGRVETVPELVNLLSLK